MMNQNLNYNKNAILSHPVWVQRRELRQKLPLGHLDVFYKSLYSTLSPCHTWRGGESSRRIHGGIYSLEFSLDGSHLVAGCEKSSLLMFDTLSRKLINTVHNAHASCITNVKFLDSRIFATGSADKTVSLWDARNLNTRMRSLRVNTSTIGNLAFSRKNNLLITSGPDGFISTWDIKTFVKQRELCKKISWSYVLTRLRINPDESKMVLSTGRGFLMIVHNLDLDTLSLDEFELYLFGLSQLNQGSISRFLNWTPFLSPNRRRNRVEVVTDYPNVGGLHAISSLEIHPQGWSALSRSKCIAKGQRSLWTCVHDIQEKEPDESWDPPRRRSMGKRPLCPLPEADAGEAAGVGVAGTSGNNCSSEPPAAASSVKTRARKRRDSCRETNVRADSSRGSNVRANPPTRPVSAPPGPLEGASTSRNRNALRVVDPPSYVRPSASDGQLNRAVHERYPRMTHYIQEPVASEWYFDTMCLSFDGRLISYPMNRGVRLLTFSPECSEIPIPGSGTEPSRLHELKTEVSHKKPVLCTKFSPRHYLLVSGCMGGDLTWYEPGV